MTNKVKRKLPQIPQTVLCFSGSAHSVLNLQIIPCFSASAVLALWDFIPGGGAVVLQYLVFVAPSVQVFKARSFIQYFILFKSVLLNPFAPSFPSN